MRRNIFVLLVTILLFSVVLVGCGKKGYRSIKVFSVTGSVDVVRNKKTIEAEEDMKNPSKSNSYSSVEELMKDLLKDA